jgi:hypothetical protein
MSSTPLEIIKLLNKNEACALARAFIFESDQPLCNRSGRFERPDRYAENSDALRIRSWQLNYDLNYFLTDTAFAASIITAATFAGCDINTT